MLMDGKVAPVPTSDRTPQQTTSRTSIDKGTESLPLWKRTLRMSIDMQYRSAIDAFERHSKRAETLASQEPAGPRQPSRQEQSRSGTARYLDVFDLSLLLHCAPFLCTLSTVSQPS